MAKNRETADRATALKIKRERRECEECGVSGRGLHAHHRLTYSAFPESRGDASNLEILCAPCHAKRHPEHLRKVILATYLRPERKVERKRKKSFTEPLHLPGEEWRAIPGWEGLYEASDFGRARSLPRLIAKGGWHGKGHVRCGGVLTLNVATRYPSFIASKDGKAKTLYIHHAVAAAFIGPRLPGLWVLHEDDDPANNRLTNLYYGTPQQNADDRIANGNAPRGRNHPNAKLTEDTVAIALEMLMAGISKTDVAVKMGVARSTLGAALSGKTWAHVEGNKENLPNPYYWSRRVRCLDDDLEFPTITEAAKYYGAQIANVAKVCQGERPKTLGRRFEYIAKEVA